MFIIPWPRRDFRLPIVILRLLPSLSLFITFPEEYERWPKGLGLKRVNRRNESRLEDIVTAILDEMERSVRSFVRYREMTRRLRVKHNIVVRHCHEGHASC